MTCEQINRILAEYLDQSLSSNWRSDFETHLSRCHSCRQYLHQYRRAMHLSRSAFNNFEADKDIPGELVCAVLSACSLT